ncbi:hypothetical protein RD110_18840 [Rhodoferax koreense]|uniref:DUF4145 domain-containing protein n=2 Tax=Rhodoferax koreensis TaxID=1842727 RepID=A0A1P8K480_9BURK|nr:hypothetical protein RD110_18840 [Rhodoferax koreense]
MSELTANCPRCGTKHVTFELSAASVVSANGWQNSYEAFCVCRKCAKSTTFVLREVSPGAHHVLENTPLPKLKGIVDDLVENVAHVSLKDVSSHKPPQHLPESIQAVFEEGATCLAVGCYNAAGTMFRLCIDLTTKTLLPQGEVEGLNSKTRRDLGLRLPWLFASGRLPRSLEDLSTCIKEDGNDGAHAGNLTEHDANDLLDFCFVLLERIFTEPAQLAIAKKRREARRAI